MLNPWAFEIKILLLKLRMFSDSASGEVIIQSYTF